MIEISLTDFVDFAVKSGPPKLTVVRTVKKRHDEGYDPKTDFYKKLRDGIVEHHVAGTPLANLDGLARGITDKNKLKAYPLLVQGYKKFLGRKDITWFASTKKKWLHMDLSVRVNPELGLMINGAPHLIKLYFKADGLGKLQLGTILHLMQMELQTKTNPKNLSVLDVRQGKLFTANEFDPGLTPLVQGEAVAFSSMYKAV